MQKEYISPSGKYKLIVENIPAKPKCWDYTCGKVYNESQELIIEVNRNYSSFPFLFIENHLNKYDYLICGSDYQGQTIIELDSKKRIDYLSPEANQGHGFCWAEYKFDEKTQILIVCGCIWAGPYEYRFYDFSDPINGWPEIECENEILDNLAEKWPTVDENEIICCYQTDEDLEDDDGNIIKEPTILSTLKFKRDGLKLVLIEEWASEKEQANRIAQAKWWKEYNRRISLFKETDELYLTHLELVKDPKLSPSNYATTGTTYEGWCKDFDKKEERWCRRIIDHYKSLGKYAVDLEWAAITGPIKIVVWKDGKHFEDKFFEHSVDGMKQAFKYAKGVCEI